MTTKIFDFMRTVISNKIRGKAPKEIFIDIAGENYGAEILNTGLHLPSGLVFDNLFFGPKGDTIIGVNKSAGKLMKIGLKKNERKLQNVAGEAVLLDALKQKGCVSCPEIIETGTIKQTDLVEVLCEPRKFSSLDLPEKLSYFVVEYIESGNKMLLADLILALLEQKSLGYYHADIKPGNIRFNDAKGVCILIDYDQARKLDIQITNFNALEFLKWCDDEEQRKYGMPTWRRHFNSLDERHFTQFMRDGAFDLSQTTLFKRQKTTNSSDGVYHTIAHKDIFANGSRNLDDRFPILEEINLDRDEKILDIGSNAGLLCHYLYDRGCDVTGAELDPFMVMAAGIISRITHRDIKFICFDLDKDVIPGYFDTIMLFSVLHHSSNVVENAKKIASSCNRIIIECRPVESGKKANQEAWQESSRWNYGDINGLVNGLENLFPGFVLGKNHGIGGKSRYILEFVKKDV